MNPCVYGLREYFKSYCFDERNVPAITPEKQEEIRRLTKEIPPWMKVKLENLEYAGRVNHHDLSITINSPEPEYKI